LRISESAAAKVLRRAADTVPGIRAASCRITPSQGGEAAHIVTITAAATLDQPLHGRAQALREAVLNSAELVLGLTVTAVHIEINAVLHLSVPSDDRSELRDR
ncbi:hypothetical protein ACFVJM_33285, partial [Streptomyces virginiae]